MNKNLHSYLIQIFRSAIEILEIDIRGSPGPESQGPTPDNPVVSIRVTHWWYGIKIKDSYRPWIYCIALVVLNATGEDGSYGCCII